jgi:hypothetical protein
MAAGITKIGDDSEQRELLRRRRDELWKMAPADILKLYPNPKKCGESFDEMIKADDGDDDGGDSVVNHPVAQLARLLVAAGVYPDLSSALHFLLRRPAGVALVQTHKAKDHPMDTVHSIMKDGGVAATSAAIVAKGSTSLSRPSARLPPSDTPS